MFNKITIFNNHNEYELLHCANQYIFMIYI